MSPEARHFFVTYFPILSGRETPYPWQSALFERLIAGDWPDSIALPTGAGKTAVIHIWLLALAWQKLFPTPVPFPRRLFWVVNRRVLVDQATREVLAARDALAAPGNEPLAGALRAWSRSGVPLAVSTLRGEMADNREWSRDPSTPAIVIGTVDMIGSRLLFRGYGAGKYFRPSHAGLIGVDSLIVNDESHLTPAFARLLTAARGLARESRLPGFRVLRVSATERGLGDRPFDHSIDADLAQSPRFASAYRAEKRLFLHQAADRKSAEAKLVGLALESPAPRTILFVEEPGKAAEVAARIGKQLGGERVALLTGTMRGFERDRLAAETVFRLFQEAEPPAEPACLVATSAAEVGVDITSERLITMLVESDRLLQRFGRLNRFGARAGEAHVVYLPAKAPRERDAIVQRTFEYLQPLCSVSPAALAESPPPEETRSAVPRMARLDRRLIDLWAQTTLGDRSAPRVEDWLHGQQENYPETAVAWREDVAFLADAPRDCVERVLENYPMLARERLSEPSTDVRKKLEALAVKAPETRALLVASDGSVEAAPLATLAASSNLAYGTLLLPPGCGALERGMFVPGSDAGCVYDVADVESGRRRYLAAPGDGGWSWRRLASTEVIDAAPSPISRQELAAFAAAHDLQPPILVPVPSDGGEEGAERRLIYFPGARKRKSKRTEVPLCEHLAAVAAEASALAAQLCGEAFRADFERAGSLHDKGKACELWQRAMGGSVEKPLAKSAAAANPSLLAGFRHELASLLDCADADCSDLALHLVASHHGWARPYWDLKSYNHRTQPTQSERVALEAARRFGRLHRDWGAWGLAYLEAVFKSVDGLVSAAQEEDTHA